MSSVGYLKSEVQTLRMIDQAPDHVTPDQASKTEIDQCNPNQSTLENSESTMEECVNNKIGQLEVQDFNPHLFGKFKLTLFDLTSTSFGLTLTLY